MDARPLSTALVAALIGASALSVGCGGSVASTLRDARSARQAPAGLVVVYDDRSAVWGGNQIAIAGDGALSLRRRRPGGEGGDDGPPDWAGAVGPEQVSSLVSLLVEVRAWEQHHDSSGNEPLDASRARLRISVEGGQSEIWEWSNDLETNARLVRIKTYLERLVQTAGRARTPVPQPEHGQGDGDDT